MADKAKRTESRFPRYFCIVFCLALLLLTQMQYFKLMDGRYVDALFKFRGVELADPRVVIVEIDDEALKKVGAYPWPRSAYKKLIDGLFAYGVKSVGLDILFPDPSRPEEDRALVELTKRYADKLVHSVYTRAIMGTTDLEYVYPFPALHKAAKHLALVHPEQDEDGFIRYMALFGTNKVGINADDVLTDPDRLPTLGMATLAIAEGKSPDEYGKALGMNMIRLNLRGERKIFEWREKAGEYEEVEVGKVRGFKYVAAWPVMSGELDAMSRGALKGAMVLVGTTAKGAFDHFPNAFTDSMPGVESHATLIDNLLRNSRMKELPLFLTHAMVVILLLLARWLVTLSPLYAGLGFIAVALGWVGASYGALKSQYFLEFTAPAVAFGGTFIALMVHRAMQEYAQKREVRQMFGQYVAPEVVDILVRDPDKLKLGGDRRDMTMFFLDIAHFTTISEKMKAENLIQFLNHYLTALTDDILSNKGVVDKYIGDCIMAFWNAPLDEPNHREKACLAAVACLRTIERLNKEYVDPTIPEKPAVRIGLNSGDVVVGNTGSARKLAYTVLGDEVNLASRLEGANKFFGSTVMASENTYKEAAGAVEARPLGRVRVVGKAIPILVYELLGKKGEVGEAWQKALPLYRTGVEKYNNREFAPAKADFEAVLKHLPNDKVTKLYLNVCQDFCTIPPPPEWDGVFNLTSK
ncbi:MAG: adenylate/guanylate cyclase domain-containing protein [Elusimicrobiota bacterium]